MAQAEDKTVRERFEAGLAMRRQVLGDEHVERSLEKATDFGRPLQELVTEYCWGGVWTRDGLHVRDRSLINLAMLAALGRGHELSVHVRGAVRNGVTRREIQEVLIQAGVYAGLPVALEAFRIAERTLTELEEDGVEVAE